MRRLVVEPVEAVEADFRGGVGADLPRGLAFACDFEPGFGEAAALDFALEPALGVADFEPAFGAEAVTSSFGGELGRFR